MRLAVAAVLVVIVSTIVSTFLPDAKPDMDALVRGTLRPAADCVFREDTTAFRRFLLDEESETAPTEWVKTHPFWLICTIIKANGGALNDVRFVADSYSSKPNGIRFPEDKPRLEPEAYRVQIKSDFLKSTSRPLMEVWCVNTSKGWRIAW